MAVWHGGFPIGNDLAVRRESSKMLCANRQFGQSHLSSRNNTFIPFFWKKVMNHDKKSCFSS